MRIERSAPIQIQQDLNIDKDSELYKAAKGMEANFMKEMLKNMRKTVQESPEMQNNQGYQVFRGMLDEQYAEKATNVQGIGLAEVIIRQVLEMQENARPQKPVEIRPVNENDFIKKEI